MPILAPKETPVQKHVNPALRTGEVYRVLAALPSYVSTIGRTFTVSGCAAEVVWLSQGEYKGGYDNVDILERKAILFEVCTLQQL